MDYRMFASNFYHLANYSLAKTKTNYEKATLTFSIDVDVGDRRLGTLNGGKNDANVHHFRSEQQIGEMEERTWPLFINAFDEYEVPATFAIRGQLAELGLRLNDIFGSKTIHEIGSHGYYHKPFNFLSIEEAEMELALASKGNAKMGLTPTSFIYPRNQVAYLNLLPMFGYTCYRSLGGIRLDAMFIEQNGELCNEHPSLYLNNSVNLLFLKRILKVAINKKAPLHIWFHLWNFGFEEAMVAKYLQNTFKPFLGQARKNADMGRLNLETMSSLTNYIDK